jgi:hypothetical protein
LIGCLRIARINGAKQLCDVGHGDDGKWSGPLKLVRIEGTGSEA